jgi:3-oxoacyl-[acyl-carrier protein] reductase
MDALQDRVVVVTGASRQVGIGAALVRRVAADGAAVVVHAWSPADAEQPWGADEGFAERLVDEIRTGGGRAVLVAEDFADPAAPARLIGAACDEFGHVDAVVANHARSSEQTLADLTADELDLCHAINTRATLLLVQQFAAQHDGRPGGRVVLFTSGQYHGAMPNELPYIATKATLHELTRTLAVELIDHNITVNCIDPGPNDTGYASDEVRAYVAERHPAGRWGLPSDAARLVGWLLSDEADWVTGQTIASDGGWSSR